MCDVQWKKVPGFYDLYEASSDGRIKKLSYISKTGRHYPERICKSGKAARPAVVTVCDPRTSEPRQHYQHELVALAFLGQRPDGYEICHNDGNFRNNAVSNLRYGTRASNQQDRVAHGTDMRATKHPMNKLSEQDVTEILDRCAKGERFVDVARSMGVSGRLVSYLVKGERWKWFRDNKSMTRGTMKTTGV